MGARWLLCNVRKGTRWLYRGYTWQRLVQSSVLSFGGTPCRALRELRAELHQRLYQKLCQKLCTKLCQKLYRKLYQSLYTKLCQRLSTQSSTRTSTKALHGPPP